MGTIVCQCCNKIIDHFEYEKTTVLFGQCHDECEHEVLDQD